jgi:hypothetical protein
MRWMTILFIFNLWQGPEGEELYVYPRPQVLIEIKNNKLKKI